MGDFVAHPGTLLIVGIACSPALLPLARFFFDDLETFKSEAGLDYDHNRALWLLGWPRLSLQLRIKAIGFVAVFAGLVTAVYLTTCRLLY